MAKLLYQGHGSFRLTTDGGAVVYIDPFAGEGYDVPADIILVTHQHSDHNQTDLCAKKPGCRIIDNNDALRGGEHRSFDECGMHIEAAEACNRNHSPKECVGYLVTVDGLLLYFSGDTSTTAQMASLAERGIDYAFLPTDGIYNMDIDEAVKCAELIGAKHTVPVHTAPGKLFDAERAARFRCEGAMIIEAGSEVRL